MANGIGQLERDLDIAEAKGVGSKVFGIDIGTQEERGELGGRISSIAERGIQAGADVAKFQEGQRVADVNAEKDAQLQQLLSSGKQGVVEYAKEIGLDEKKYSNLAGITTDTKGLLSIYDLMQKDAQKQLDLKSKQAIDADIASFGQELSSIGGIEDPAEFEKRVNELVQKAGTLKPEAQKNALALVSKLRENRASRGATGLGEERLAFSKGQANIKNEDELNKRIELRTKENRESIEFVNKALNLSEAALRNPKGKNAAADIALIMSFNKILDPGSVVREGEYDRVEKAQGMLNWLAGMLSSMTASGGAKLTDSARISLVESMKSMKQLSEFSMLERSSALISVGLRRGLNPKNIAPDFFQSNPKEWKVLIKSLSPDATEADIEAWKDIRSNLLQKAINSANEAAKSQGTDSGYTGSEDLISGISSDFGTTVPTVIEGLNADPIEISTTLDTPAATPEAAPKQRRKATLEDF